MLTGHSDTQFKAFHVCTLGHRIDDLAGTKQIGKR